MERNKKSIQRRMSKSKQKMNAMTVLGAQDAVSWSLVTEVSDEAIIKTGIPYDVVQLTDAMPPHPQQQFAQIAPALVNINPLQFTNIYSTEQLKLRKDNE